MSTDITGARGAEPDLQAMVDELILEHNHDEPYVPDRNGVAPRFVARHRAKVPSLIDQLLDPVPGGSGELSGATAGSRPAVRVEALDTISLIADEAGEWIDQLGGVIPADRIDAADSTRGGRVLPVLRGSGAKRALVVLRALHAGLSGEDRCSRSAGIRVTVEPVHDEACDLGEDCMCPASESDSKDSPLRRQWCCTAHHVEADVRAWWRQARIISGWDSPTYRPRATCPVCSKRSGLRINLGAHTGVCVECRTVWEPTTIGLLAEHIRREVEGVDDEPDDVLDELLEEEAVVESA